MHTRSKTTENKEPENVATEETLTMQEETTTTTPAILGDTMPEQIEAGDVNTIHEQVEQIGDGDVITEQVEIVETKETNPKKDIDIMSMFAALMEESRKMSNRMQENKKSQETMVNKIDKIEESQEKMVSELKNEMKENQQENKIKQEEMANIIEEKFNKIYTIEKNIKEQIRNQTVELKREMVRMREEKFNKSYTIVYNKQINKEENIGEEEQNDEIKEITINIKELETQEIELDAVNEGKNEFKEVITCIIKQETQEIELMDINENNNDTNNGNINGKIRINRSKRKYVWGINNEETLNGENKKKKKNSKMENKHIIRQKRRKIRRQRKQDIINGKYGENRELISKKIMRYINRSTQKYNKNHILIHGTRITRRTAKRKPNVLYEGPFRIKTNGSL